MFGHYDKYNLFEPGGKPGRNFVAKLTPGFNLVKITNKYMNKSGGIFTETQQPST